MENQEGKRPEEQNSNHESVEIAALVLGVSSLVLSLSMFNATQLLMKLLLGLAAAVVGLVLGISSNKVRKTKRASAAIITSVIALCLYMFSLVACSACAIIGFAFIGTYL